MGTNWQPGKTGKETTDPEKKKKWGWERQEGVEE